jgi:hypothetical protein
MEQKQKYDSGDTFWLWNYAQLSKLTKLEHFEILRRSPISAAEPPKRPKIVSFAYVGSKKREKRKWEKKEENAAGAQRLLQARSACCRRAAPKVERNSKAKTYLQGHTCFAGDRSGVSFGGSAKFQKRVFCFWWSGRQINETIAEKLSGGRHFGTKKTKNCPKRVNIDKVRAF